MLDKTINRSFLFIKYPASDIQHHFVSGNVIFTLSTRRFEAKLRWDIREITNHKMRGYYGQ